MTGLLDRVIAQRADEQVEAVEVERVEHRAARRLVCWCGCGRWFYREPGHRGRDQRYATRLCKSRAGHRRERQ